MEKEKTVKEMERSGYHVRSCTECKKRIWFPRYWYGLTSFCSDCYLLVHSQNSIYAQKMIHPVTDKQYAELQQRILDSGCTIRPMTEEEKKVYRV